MGGGPLIVGIGGSAGPDSVTGHLLHDCLALAADSGARTVAFDGDALAGLPIFSPHELQRNAIADELVDAVRGRGRRRDRDAGLSRRHVRPGQERARLTSKLLRDDARPYLDGRAVGVIVSRRRLAGVRHRAGRRCARPSTRCAAGRRRSASR